MWGVRPRASCLLLSLLAWLAAEPGRAQERSGAGAAVAAVAFVEADERVIDQVEKLGVALQRKLGVPDEPGLRVRAQAWSEPLVLVVDSRRDMLSVLRRADQSMLSRVFDPGALAHSPYAGALAATELLRLLAYVPVVEVEVPSPARPQASRTGVDVTSATAPGESQGWSSRGYLAAGGQLMASLGLAPSLLRPEFVLGLEAGPARARSFGLAQLTSAPLGRTRRDVPGTDEDERVAYRRSDIGLRLGLGTRVLGGSILGYLSSGVGFTKTDVRDGEQQLGAHRNIGAWTGLGGLFRWEFAKYFTASLGAELGWQFRPTRYLVRGRTILEEAPLRVCPAFSVGATLP